MTDNTKMRAGDRARILRATLWALLAGAVIAVAVVLPAEYGVDPTGFGRLTGLTALARTRAAERAAEGMAGSISATAPAETGADVSGRAPPLSVWSVAHPDHFQVQKYEVKLKGDEELEYKAVVNRGEPLLYSWRVREGSQVYFEFHGEPTEGIWPKDYYESYEKGEGTGGQGSMVAPFTGHHGWYFLNLDGKPVTVEVELAGYFRDFSRVGEVPAAESATAP